MLRHLIILSRHGPLWAARGQNLAHCARPSLAPLLTMPLHPLPPPQESFKPPQSTLALGDARINPFVTSYSGVSAGADSQPAGSGKRRRGRRRSNRVVLCNALLTTALHTRPVPPAGLQRPLRGPRPTAQPHAQHGPGAHRDQPAGALRQQLEPCGRVSGRRLAACPGRGAGLLTTPQQQPRGQQCMQQRGLTALLCQRHAHPGLAAATAAAPECCIAGPPEFAAAPGARPCSKRLQKTVATMHT